MAFYMIHTIPERQWYVENYLIQSMLEQGIDRSHIVIYEDTNHLGNLAAFKDSVTALNVLGGYWHLQDDIIISSRFKRVTEENDKGVVAGFCSQFDKSLTYWYSFQCIRIPNVFAYDFSRWLDTQAKNVSEYRAWIEKNKYDDSLFQEYLKIHCIPMKLLDPNIVNHVDHLIGGSVVNKGRELMTSTKWSEPELIDKLRKELADGNRVKEKIRKGE